MHSRLWLCVEAEMSTEQFNRLYNISRAIWLADQAAKEGNIELCRKRLYSAIEGVDGEIDNVIRAEVLGEEE